ncbi:ABC transporter substrate-binding protein [Devosia sp.]|uniref:ABC transporter substrate-binding protein n=1 Tax=Devosia sp. TaxID=1871048 RepID=UPI00086D92A0|nr:ABC transporter substrate-binding protein [Devosia sp.]ODT81894.1 MAG: ABC transporter substrate-binding protein [Pelagibacterium sp. SCN 64-44]
MSDLKFTLSRRALLAGSLASLAMPALIRPAFAQGEPLRFGVADPLTGPSAIFGEDQMQAVRWAVEDINAAGGVHGRPLEAIIVDHQAKPEVGIAVVTRLVQVDQVPAYITAFSNVVKAVAPIANREKRLMLSVGANSPDIKNLGDYVYTTFPLADVDMRALGTWLYTNQEKRRAAVLYVNHETGTEGAKIFREAFTAAGGEIVLNESYEEQRSDFTSLVLQVRAANPDVVHIHSVVSDFTAIVAQMRQLGLNMQVTSFQTAFNPQMIEELGAGAEGIIVTALAPSVEDNANLPAFLQRWQDTHGREPNGLPYTQYWYDAPHILARVFERVIDSGEEITGTSMRQALLDIGEFDLPLTNKITINPDHTVQAPTYFWQVKDGKFQVVGKL